MPSASSCNHRTIPDRCVGVTIVQYRDKHNDTSDSIRVANALHSVTSKHGVPLIINDRVDVALAVEAEGVHIGQDDMSTYSFEECVDGHFGPEN